MLRLLQWRKTYTTEVYFPNDEMGIATAIGLLNSFFWVPLLFGLWFHSWWVWFGVLAILITFTLIFFYVIDSFPIAVGGVVIFSLFWGAFGYFAGEFVGKAIGFAPPALIVGVICYMIALCIFILPLMADYRFTKKQANRQGMYGRNRSRNRWQD